VSLSLLASNVLGQSDEKPSAENTQTINVRPSKAKQFLSYKSIAKKNAVLMQVLPKENSGFDIRWKWVSRIDGDDLPNLPTTKVGDSFRYQLIPTAHGFFEWPQLEDAVKEDADVTVVLPDNLTPKQIMLRLDLLVKVEPNNKLPYTAFANAIQQANTMYPQLSWSKKLLFNDQLKYDGIKFCFEGQDGIVKILDKEWAQQTEQRCISIPFDLTLVSQNPEIEIQGTFAYARLRMLPSNR
jgi:hypothetical protein